ncbi:HNH endonuclease [Cryobacterium sp. TMB3-1-2]|nr:HNH endonuclease [Cryobacterium sp. TMB3-1-2]TFC67393.1 HNH endonuclease [Cryobacterium sp. TMB3-15]TFC73456.1 HNH endonuclease [Cryobacterium sp. TMB3-10]TFD46194.1 HNH endonuclease [Cryobacterium sp. TMB3-12]
MTAANKAYVQTHKAKTDQYQAAWRDANRARIADNNTQWRANNRERVRVKARAWAKRNPEIVTLRSRVRRHLKYATPISRDALAARHAYLGDVCWICRDHPTRLTWDHVKPLSKGGPHMLANLRLACQSCNSRKSAKWYGIAGLDRLVAEIAAATRQART